MQENDELLGESSRAEQPADPQQPPQVDAAIAAFTFRTIDAELAQVTFDSAAPGAEPAVPSGATARMVTFETGTLTIELEIIPQDGTINLIGQILPPAVVQVDVRQVDLVSTGSTDGLGRFALVLPIPGPFQLSLPYAGLRGGAAVTEWISV